MSQTICSTFEQFIFKETDRVRIAEDNPVLPALLNDVIRCTTIINYLATCTYVTPLNTNHLKHNKHCNDYSAAKILFSKYFLLGYNDNYLLVNAEAASSGKPVCLGTSCKIT